ncbi:succinate dehydrogenase hydrophobic anchor subunit [Vogesella perlucida]|nr:succinate dehydrogenase hydrophobic anchor subunit [Vogesella perlucida]
MKTVSHYLPSRASAVSIILLSLLAGLAIFWVLSADVDCGAQHWSCSGFSGIALVALSIGTACALLFTALLALVSSALRRLWSRIPLLEPQGKTLRISGALVAAHIGAFGILNLLGLLPQGWLWWLGLFGLVGIGTTGQAVYIVN